MISNILCKDKNTITENKFSLFLILKITIINIYKITFREQLLKMCKISHLNGSIITIIIFKQKTKALKPEQPFRPLRQHLGNILTVENKQQQQKNTPPPTPPTHTVIASWLCLHTLCLQMKYRLNSGFETRGCNLGICRPYIQYQSRLMTAYDKDN